MTPDYTDPHLKLTTATRALIQQAKASGQSCTDATRQAEEALRGVEPEQEEPRGFVDWLVRLYAGHRQGPERGTVAGNAVFFHAAPQGGSVKPATEQPPAVEGDDPWKTATFANLLLKWENSASDRNERLTAIQSYCRSAARAAEERGRREEREAIIAILQYGQDIHERHKQGLLKEQARLYIESIRGRAKK